MKIRVIEMIKSEQYTVDVDGREWTVIVDSRKEDSVEFVVQYPDEDKSQIVHVGDNGSDHFCTGTYFEYNKTCPHIEACEEVYEEKLDREESTKEAEIDVGSAVYCEICDKVHSGQCDFQQGDDLWAN